ncbi:hypothetical protein QWM81_22615 [Streptomyces ficellus]|uniref:Uncharacterized protein n=1 Tax=Streptomyces ficellus TaxID=1977088 RepID=A0ABT7ZBA8_9ACTN|nr:hypothetical protein [Streptomyces ficellus]MDN3296788.1 hypothetical protein [Streptomyces ficellus]
MTTDSTTTPASGDTLIPDSTLAESGRCAMPVQLHPYDGPVTEQHCPGLRHPGSWNIPRPP